MLNDEKLKMIHGGGLTNFTMVIGVLSGIFTFVVGVYEGIQNYLQEKCSK